MQVPKPTYKKREFKRSVVKEACPLEDSEHIALADWLRLHKIRFHHSPNGGIRNIVTATRFKRMGVSPGFPDFLILDRPTVCIEGKLFVGAAVEMKRRKKGIVSPEQRDWLEALTELGWACKVARGFEDAVGYLASLGYGKRL